MPGAAREDGGSAAAREAAYAIVYGWYERVSRNTLDGVAHAISVDGLPVANALVRRIYADLDSLIEELPSRAAESRRPLFWSPLVRKREIRGHERIEVEHRPVADF